MVQRTSADHDGDMNDSTNETQSEAVPEPTAPEPQSSDQSNRDWTNFTGLRRSTSDKYIAGVAGGLARHWQIDPVLVRVVLTIAIFFGGAGLLIYGAVWLFVPADDQESAAINMKPDTLRLALLVTAAVAGLAAIGDAFGNGGIGWPLVVMAIVVALVVLTGNRLKSRTTGADNSGATASANPAPATGAAQPPARTGIVLFWPTLALIAIGSGVLTLISVYGSELPEAAWPALALAIVGAALVWGAFRDRTGGLVILGSVLALALVITASGPNDTSWDSGQRKWAPTAAAEVEGSYSHGAGEFDLDLTEVRDPQELAGRTIEVSLTMGEIDIEVPRDLPVRIDAEVGLVGQIDIPGYTGGGYKTSATRFVGEETQEPLVLDLRVKVGQIKVEVD